MELQNQESDVPGNFEIAQNYPNQINGEAAISFTVPQAERVEIAVFDVLVEQVTSDIYLVRLETGEPP